MKPIAMNPGIFPVHASYPHPLRENPVMRFAILFAAILFSAISVCSQSLQDSVAFDFTPIAGIETSTALKDGVGEQAGFQGPTSLWGDGTYLYVADGTALRRITIVSREVTTITRLAGSGWYRVSGPIRNSGLHGLWGDGSYIYTIDEADHNVRRISLSTALIDIIAKVPGPPTGLVGDDRYLYVGDNYNHTIDRIDIADASLTEFVTPPGPIDPYRCGLGSGCIGYYVKSPTSLSIDGNNIYATGFNTTRRPNCLLSPLQCGERMECSITGSTAEIESAN
jgi:hypothetical protein